MDARVLVDELMDEAIAEETAIEHARRELDDRVTAVAEKRALIAMLRARIAARSPAAEDVSAPAGDQAPGGLSAPSRQRRTPLHVAVNSGWRSGFTAAVTATVRGMPAGSQFDVNELLPRLAEAGVLMPLDPKSRLATVLGRLVERGVITRVFAGGGNVPNRYIFPEATQQTTAPAPEHADLA